MPGLYMVVEHFRNADAACVSSEAAERMAPRL